MVILGVAVLVVALLALRSPGGGKQRTAAAASSSSPSSGATSSSRASKAPSTSSSSRSSGGFAPSVGRSSSDASSPAALKRTVPLIVLNNTTTSGLAQSAASRFEDGGWRVDSFGNLSNNILSTCAYFDPASTNAKAAAQALQRQFPTIKRVRERFSSLPAGPVVVVLTPDYSTG